MSGIRGPKQQSCLHQHCCSEAPLAGMIKVPAVHGRLQRSDPPASLVLQASQGEQAPAVRDLLCRKREDVQAVGVGAQSSPTWHTGRVTCSCRSAFCARCSARLARKSMWNRKLKVLAPAGSAASGCARIGRLSILDRSMSRSAKTDSACAAQSGLVNCCEVATELPAQHSTQRGWLIKPDKSCSQLVQACQRSTHRGT